MSAPSSRGRSLEMFAEDPVSKPFVSDPDFTLWNGSVLDVLPTLEPESVHCVVTSPPYWGLRDYGTGEWEGGSADCDHRESKPSRIAASVAASGLDGGKSMIHGSHVYGAECGRCGARRVDRQLGLEATPDEYVARMVEVFREVRRVLRRDGTCWLNLGDSYAQLDGQGNLDEQREPGQHGAFRVSPNLATVAENRGPRRRSLPPGLKRKDLVGIPWRVAFALQADGWYLRSDIIWSKPNPMPESVTDRPTKAHEYLFLLTRSARYFYDADAIREPAEWARWGDQTNTKHEGSGSAAGWIGSKPKKALTSRRSPLIPEQTKAGVGRQGRDSETFGLSAGPLGRNRRSVWEVCTEPYPEAHFAVFPQALVEPCVLAGSPTGGVVLDPFMGSGTTALVARRLGRRSIGIELNESYCELAARRLGQQSLLAEDVA